MILENKYIKLEINLLGAELKSAFLKKEQRELIYDGNSSYWNRSSPILFPIVGRLKNNEYKWKDKLYNLTQHGFARDHMFTLKELTANSVSFNLISDDKTFALYPFDFELKITYKLVNRKVEVHYSLLNPMEEQLPFCIGAHPAFIYPSENKLDVNVYEVIFEREENLEKYLLEPSSGLFSGEKQSVLLKNRGLELSSETFNQDALVFKNLNSNWVLLKNKTSNSGLKFAFSGFPYFAIWSKTQAPFICLEPWYGLADSVDSSGDLLKKEGIQILENKSTFSAQYSFEWMELI